MISPFSISAMASIFDLAIEIVLIQKYFYRENLAFETTLAK